MKTSHLSSLALIAVTVCLPSFASAVENCVSLTSKAENLNDSGAFGQAQDTAKKAIAACAKEKQKTARPFMVLATAANATQDYDGTIRWANEGLKQEPNLPLAHMDICAAYIGKEQYDLAVAACKKGLTKPNPWSAKLNHNLGLAIFKKFVALEQYAKAGESEPYFKESQKLDPKIAANYHYLGTIAQALKNDLPTASVNFKKGCELKYQSSCESLQAVQAALAKAPAQGATAQSSAAAKSAPVSGNEAQLWDLIKKGYIKKGLQPAQAEQTIQGMKANMAKMAPDQRLMILQNMAKDL